MYWRLAVFCLQERIAALLLMALPIDHPALTDRSLQQLFSNDYRQTSMHCIRPVRVTHHNLHHRICLKK